MNPRHEGRAGAPSPAAAGRPPDRAGSRSHRRKDATVHEHTLPRTRHDPSSGSSAAADCACTVPVPVQRAERKGVARTHCARCGRPLPLRFAAPSRALP